MPRYIDADALLERMKRTPRYFDVKHDIEATPTADVVPKSEADNLIKVIDNTTQQFLELHDLYQNEKREVERLINERDEYKKHVDEDIIYVHRIKAEVAREIFEEIERLCDAHLYWNNCSIIQRDDIAELKKKYTEDNDVH